MIQKIFSIEQIRMVDQYTIEHEPVASIDLMERAAKECVLWLKQKAQINQEFAIFCGPGNNGGDGLVIARLLAEDGYGVKVFVLNLNDRFSDDFSINYERLKSIEYIQLFEWKEMPNEFPEFSADTIIIDAVFGSGLSKPLKGFSAQVIKKLNECHHIKVAIDIPSGLFADKAMESLKDMVFFADYTLSFQFPKLSFLLPENELYVGQWNLLDIGLFPDYIYQTQTPYYYLNAEFVTTLLKARAKFSHKGSFGHLLMIAGDHTKMGAAILSSKAALRSGAGLVTLHHPKASGLSQNMMPELMSSPDDSAEAFTSLPDLAKYSNIAIGPGLGTRQQTAKALKMLLQQVQNPMVFDADAINILSDNKTWLSFIPAQSVLTPHIKEFDRLLGNSKHSFERMEKAKAFSKKYSVYLILKGAHTMVFTPTSNVYFNSTGNPGMATGGSGDVLTGMIAALMAQKYSSLEASLLAVFLHGLAGDLAAEKLGFESLIASDIIEHLGQAFKLLY
ncbi:MULTISPECIES: NAD(P)H-hydrate dehydratase [unclassified Lentimicrobium]|uniref:NAD(P)H-hydrate dehydratase n=1 Tax=unclassified Lentimicrobium TaxID=2677434 RepID=UPI001557F49B|nr:MULTISPECIES: NAD(P)H-hydrate dehydratase [unclassified Lentimicrobium]NPD45777.1 NAD(P)H-hydrate dehydratase [Lentimicrobium sp. S6]NPD84792.1 NAD(P)H-hydrate dehydratase [Lentimicrobium sp. L6]